MGDLVTALQSSDPQDQPCTAHKALFAEEYYIDPTSINQLLNLSGCHW